MFRLFKRTLRRLIKMAISVAVFSILLACSINLGHSEDNKNSSTVTQAAPDKEYEVSTTESDTEFIIVAENPDEPISYEEIPDYIYDDNYEVTYIPEYNGDTWIILNNNVPNFDTDDFQKEFEIHSPLDSLNRCGVAYANISTLTMPTEEREDISMIYPTGWNQVLLDDDYYLYNRCHLIAFCLAGENANELNLITGTSYFNQVGMWEFESQVQEYCYQTGLHVLYRVTPYYFEEDDLLPYGVQIEALSEDGALCFNVFVYNHEPNITLDYKTGKII